MPKAPLDTLADAVDRCSFADPADALSPERVFSLRNEINALHHFAACHPTTPTEARAALSELLELTGHLYALLEAVRAADDSVGHNRAARTFGALSGLTGMLEEFATGEDPLGEVLVGGVPYLLDRMAETSYIRSAEIAFRAALPSHTTRIVDRLWDLAASRRMGAPLARLACALSGSALDDRLRFVLHVLLYTVLIQAAADRLGRALDRAAA
jgi:hypothetical protein